MIWAAIWVENQSVLTVLSRDPEAKRMDTLPTPQLGNFEANTYSIWEPGLGFMQDGFPIHQPKK